MKGSMKKMPGFALLLALVLELVPVQALKAEDHLLTRRDLEETVSAASSARQNNQAKVQKFLSTEPVRKALSSAGLKSARIERAIPQLSDEELAKLALQSERIQNDLTAGALTNQQLTYIVIALATATLILIIVAAR